MLDTVYGECARFIAMVWFQSQKVSRVGLEIERDKISTGLVGSKFLAKQVFPYTTHTREYSDNCDTRRTRNTCIRLWNKKE